MKATILLRICIAAFLPLWLASCNGHKGSMLKAGNAIEFDTINREERYFLDNDPSNPSCNLTVKLVYPKTAMHFDAKAIQAVFIQTVLGNGYDTLSAHEAVTRYAESYVANYKNDARIYRANRSAGRHSHSETSDDLYLADNDPVYLPEIFYSYYENISDSIVYNRYGIVSYRVKQSNSKGESMSYETVKSFVLDLSNGSLMSEGDIFSAGYDVALRPIIQNALLEQNGVKSIRDLEDLGFFGIEEILPNNNFLITDKGIAYTFNKGEYSAYRLPAPEVFIPFEAVRSLLRENTAVSKLSGLKTAGL